MQGIDVAALIEDSLLIGDPILVGVFEHQNTITLRPAVVPMTIVFYFGCPNTTEMINVNIGDIGNLGFAGKESAFQPVGNVEAVDSFNWIACIGGECSGWQKNDQECRERFCQTRHRKTPKNHDGLNVPNHPNSRA